MITGFEPPRGTSHGGATIRLPASIARQILLRAARPVLVGHVNGRCAEQVRRNRCCQLDRGGITRCGGPEEHAPGVSAVIFVDRDRLEVVEQRVEAVAQKRGNANLVVRNVGGVVASC